MGRYLVKSKLESNNKKISCSKCIPVISFRISYWEESQDGVQKSHVKQQEEVIIFKKLLDPRCVLIGGVNILQNQLTSFFLFLLLLDNFAFKQTGISFCGKERVTRQGHILKQTNWTPSPKANLGGLRTFSRKLFLGWILVQKIKEVYFLTEGD